MASIFDKRSASEARATALQFPAAQGSAEIPVCDEELMTPADVLRLPAQVFSSRSARWTVLLSITAVVALWPTWPALLKTWSESADYNHGPLIALIALLWLFYASRHAANESRPGSWPALVLLALALGVWLISFKAHVEAGKQTLAPLIIWLAVASGAGWRAAIALAAPVFYLYFAIPIWEALVPLLQWMTVTVTRGALGAIGIPVKIDGVLVTIPEGSFIVQEGCSGKKYLMVAVALAWLVAAMNSLGRRRALLYLATAAGLALVANWIRVIIIIYAGHVTDMKHYFVAREHVTLGWLIFLVLIAVVVVVGSKLRGLNDAEVRSSSGSISSAGPTGYASRVPTLALLCFPTLAFALMAHARVPAPAAATSLPAPIEGWQGPLAPSEAWMPAYSGATTQARAAFESGGQRVEAYSATFATQAEGTELIHYSNRMYGEGWTLYSKQISNRTLSQERSLSVTALKARSPSAAIWLIDYYYVVDGVLTPRESTAQLLYGLRSWTHAADSSVVIAAAACAPNSCDAAGSALQAYWSARSDARADVQGASAR